MRGRTRKRMRGMIGMMEMTRRRIEESHVETKAREREREEGREKRRKRSSTRDREKESRYA